jgi:hypothetical protein
LSLCKSRSRENIAAAAIVPFIERQPTENKELRFAKEKLRIFFDAEFFAPLAGISCSAKSSSLRKKRYRPLAGIICETAYHEVGHLFPPPYGDHILNISQPIEKRKSQKVGKCLLYCNAVNLHKKEQMQTLRL